MGAWIDSIALIARCDWMKLPVTADTSTAAIQPKRILTIALMRSGAIHLEGRWYRTGPHFPYTGERSE